MNYLFQTDGLIINGAQGTLDYSRFLLANLDENQLNETVGLNGGAALANYGTMYFCEGASASTPVTNANGPINWNCNLSASEANVATDINMTDILFEPLLLMLTGYNDWPNLVFNGGAIGDLGLATTLPSQTSDTNEITPLIDSQITKTLKVTVASPGITQLPAGSSVDLTFTIANGGTQNDAYSLTSSSNVSWGSLASVPLILPLNAGASTQITIHVTVPSGTPMGTEGHFAIKATSTTSSSIQDTGEAVITSLASQCSAPTITAASANPNVLWPPNHSMIPVTVSVSTSGGCDAVLCKIISVSSNEPVGANGDWVITSNRTLNLRADRLGTGNGRVYTITVQCTDRSGNTSTKTITVTVPHDQGR